MNLPTIVCRNSKAFSIAAEDNAHWLQKHMSPYFFQVMEDEEASLALLAREMGSLRSSRHLILTDRDKRLVIACVNRPGSLYETLRRIGEREISYAMFSHSNENMPGLNDELEIQRFEFNRRKNDEIDLNQQVDIPSVLLRKVRAELRVSFPQFDLKKLSRLLKILWLNNENYIRMSPPYPYCLSRLAL